MQDNNNHVHYDSQLINTMKFSVNQMVREGNYNINFYLAKWDNNYYVNTKGKQVISIAIWTMNKIVKPMITFIQVWLSQNVTSSQSKDAIVLSISSLQLGRQLLGKCKWTTSIFNSNLVNEWDCQTKCISRQDKFYYDCLK